MNIAIQIPKAGGSNFQTGWRLDYGFTTAGSWKLDLNYKKLGFGRPKLEVEIRLPGVGILNVTSTTWKLEVEVQVQEG